jgi:hypothetical protein
MGRRTVGGGVLRLAASGLKGAFEHLFAGGRIALRMEFPGER